MTVYLRHNNETEMWAWAREQGGPFAGSFLSTADALAEACLDGGEEVEYIPEMTPFEWRPCRDFFGFRPILRAERTLVAVDSRDRVIPANQWTAGREYWLTAYHFAAEPSRPEYFGWAIHHANTLINDFDSAGAAENFEDAKITAVAQLMMRVATRQVAEVT